MDFLKIKAVVTVCGLVSIVNCVIKLFNYLLQMMQKRLDLYYFVKYW